MSDPYGHRRARLQLDLTVRRSLDERVSVAAVVRQARELVVFARSQGYRVDELVEMIAGIG